MADVQGGRIIWRLDIDESAFAAKASAAQAAAGRVGANVAAAGQGFAGFASQASSAFSRVASGLGTILKVGTVVTAALAIGLGAAAKASLNMVSSVQRSTIALTTYTGSASAAASITKELIDFARSPQGVLFNRDELLRATVLLKGAGAETSKLTGYIKAMAPAVAVSGQKFDELAQIMSKVVATGRLDAETFDQLAIRGVVLDKSLRGTAITADEFFKVLSQTIDASQLDKYAKTVDGMKIRFETAFRELGNVLLGVQYGVDGLGASFAEGGLGDAASKALTAMTEAFKNPAVVSAITDLGNNIAKIAEVFIPMIGPAVQFIARNLENLVISLSSVAAGFVVARGAAIAFGIAATIAQAAASPIVLAVTLIAIAVAAAVIAITFLAIKFGFLDDIIKTTVSVFNWLVGAAKLVWTEFVKIATIIWGYVWPAWEIMVFAVTMLWSAITTLLIPAFQSFWTAIQPLLPILRIIAIVLGVVIVGAILAFIAAMLLVVIIIVAIVAGIVWAVGRLVGIFVAGFNLIKNFVIGVWNGLRAATSGFINTFRAIITAGINYAVSIWRTITRVVGITAGAIGGVISAIQGGLSSAWNTAVGFVGRFIEIGRRIVDGIASGIRGAAHAVIEAILSVLPAPIRAAAQKLGILSPSKVLAKEIGKPMSQGIAMGIMQGAGEINSALASVTSIGSTSGMQIGAEDGTVGAGGASVVINAKQLTEADIDMGANRAMFKAGQMLQGSS